MGVNKMLVLNCQKMLEINCHFLLESTCRLHWYETDVYFLFEDNDIPYITEDKSVLSNGYQVLSNAISHRSFAHEKPYLELIISVGHVCNEQSAIFLLDTVNDLLHLMKSNTSSTTVGSQSIEDTYLYKLLVLIAKYVDSNGNILDEELDPKDQGQLNLNDLFLLIEHVKETKGAKCTKLFAENNLRRLSRKRKHVYNAFMNSTLNVTNLGKPVYGVMSGMVLALSSNSRLWKKMPYIYFSDAVKKNLGAIIRNLGIVKLPEEVVNFQLTRPLIIDRPPNPYCNSLSLLSMRNTFQINGIDICIENISEDLGALYRVQSYLKLPFGTRPNTLVIALVDHTDYMLANGEQLQNGSIFYLPQNNGNKNTPIYSGEYAYWPYMKSRLNQFVQKNKLDETDYYLPLSLDQTQELIFLSYHDWDMAMRFQVSPWIYDHEDDRLIPRKHRLSNHTLESHILSKHKNSYYINEWK